MKYYVVEKVNFSNNIIASAPTKEKAEILSKKIMKEVKEGKHLPWIDVPLIVVSENDFYGYMMAY